MRGTSATWPGRPGSPTFLEAMVIDFYLKSPNLQLLAFNSICLKECEDEIIPVSGQNSTPSVTSLVSAIADQACQEVSYIGEGKYRGHDTELGPPVCQELCKGLSLTLPATLVVGGWRCQDSCPHL